MLMSFTSSPPQGQETRRVVGNKKSDLILILCESQCLEMKSNSEMFTFREMENCMVKKKEVTRISHLKMSGYSEQHDPCLPDTENEWML